MLSLLADLPADQREAVFLAYFGDMTHSEIATFADAPLGTIKGRIRLGLREAARRVRGDDVRPGARRGLLTRTAATGQPNAQDVVG